MTSTKEFFEIVEAARLHYENLKTDIDNAKDRREHIRLTALAQGALNLLTELRRFEIGLVYTHTGDSEAYFERLKETGRLDDPDPTSVVLDVPEFKSPYDPRNVF
jgi:hypothetical protein